MKVKEIKYEEFPLLKYLASYNVMGCQSNAVHKNEGGGYGMRIVKSLGYQRREWEYFELDDTGLILKSPRGMAKQFNKKIRITNMDEMLKEYKGKIINQNI